MSIKCVSFSHAMYEEEERRRRRRRRRGGGGGGGGGIKIHMIFQTFQYKNMYMVIVYLNTIIIL